MIIGIDAGCLGIKDDRLKVGVYQVAKHLFRRLGKMDTKNHYHLYSFYPIEKEVMNLLGPRMRNIIVRPYPWMVKNMASCTVTKRQTRYLYWVKSKPSLKNTRK